MTGAAATASTSVTIEATAVTDMTRKITAARDMTHGTATDTTHVTATVMTNATATGMTHVLRIDTTPRITTDMIHTTAMDTTLRIPVPQGMTGATADTIHMAAPDMSRRTSQDMIPMIIITVEIQTQSQSKMASMTKIISVTATTAGMKAPVQTVMITAGRIAGTIATIVGKTGTNTTSSCCHSGLNHRHSCQSCPLPPFVTPFMICIPPPLSIHLPYPFHPILLCLLF